ncbi:hypothetical protein KY309_01285 [Candidatus Woesearchaeota archaeon]|nr:hypothetical protein [Candidatus Woesearchaeota archaeon]MBW3016225.1 hypothetical protein [Candidatus Woesearchaeota archaeon]
MKKILAGLLAVGSALAQTTGDWGRAIGTDMMQKPMYSGTHTVIMTIFLIGLTIAVWLWAIKLWKEIKRMK